VREVAGASVPVIPEPAGLDQGETRGPPGLQEASLDGTADRLREQETARPFHGEGAAVRDERAAACAALITFEWDALISATLIDSV
jgi:hypothetical protein